MMKQEQRLLERLRQIDGYRLEGEQLTLSSQGRGVMVLRAVYLR
jgi:heat shock protein HslJ